MTTATCAGCGEPVEAGERFCTHCGAEALPSLPEEALSTPITRRSGWTRGAKAAVAALAAALALASATAVYLGLELSATIDEREQAEAWLASTEAELDETKGRLRDSEALSSRRKVVLQQTGRVLTQVDPLLTSVDRMKEVTTRMTETQESFADNATSVIGSLAALLDYVVDVDPLYWSLPYIYGLLDDVRSGASAASSDQSRFESLERQYASASKTFEQRATRYVRAVERLDGQLKKVTGS
jgi:hypothetical protein